LLAGVGYAWVRLGFEYRTTFVTGLATNVALPCMIFTALMKSSVPIDALSVVLLAATAGYAVIGGVFWVILRLAGLEIRSYLPPMLIGNTGNLGLPLALLAFADQGLGYALAIFAVSVVIAFTAGVWLVSGTSSPGVLIKEPLVPATLLGLLFLWQGWHTPRFLTDTLDLIGQMAIPLMLLTLGVAVARLHPVRLGRAVWLSLLRLPVSIAIGVAVGLIFDLGPVAFAVLVVQLSTPVAVTSYLLAEKYGADSDTVAGLVVISTLIAIVSLPLTLAFLI